MKDLVKIYDIKNKNEYGTGNGVGDYIESIWLNKIEDIYEFMKSHNLKQVFVQDQSNSINCFYIEEWEK